MHLIRRSHSSNFPVARCLSSVLMLMLALFAATVTYAATLPAGFTETRIANGLNNPTAMSFAPDGRLFVAEQGGRLRIIKNGVLLAQPFVTISVNSAGERGLLGVAFDNQFNTNGFVYVYYTTSSAPIHNRISRFTASPGNPDVATAGSEVQIFNLPNLSSATNHNGGAIHFGPDGMLYAAVGENANPSNAPSLNTVLGKMLRINRDGTIPSDNPFFNQTTGNNRAIWARGLRNPFTFAFQPGSGRLHINDVGQNTWEEVSLGIPGADYGWPGVEGPEPPFVAGVTYPLHSYQNAGSNCAIVGAAFYNPPVPNFPSTFNGRYFFGDFCGGFIRTLNPPNYTTVSNFATGINSLVDVAVGPDGALYYLARGGGEVFRVTFTANTAPAITEEPASQTVPVGASVTFRVAASGSPAPTFQWQRNGVNIPGATATTFTIASASAADNGAMFRAIVTNPVGTATSNSATLTVLQNSPPTAAITAPRNGQTYRGGQQFSFAGTGSDPENGTLPPSAFTWRVDFHHDNHTHPHVLPVSGVTSGTFTIADRGETAATVFYRVVLTVRDSAGLTNTTFVDILPQTSNITLRTNPQGLRLTLDGQTAPTTPVLSVEGVIRSLGAPSPQTLNGTTYEFVSWSDGGAATHEVATPTNDATFTATFRQVLNTIVFTDDFEAARGWALTPGSNPATTGRWQRGDPQSTTSGGATMQLGTCDGPSVNCLITGLTSGGSVGANDVDGGLTSIQSPLIQLPAGVTLRLNFRYYFAHLNNSSTADFFRVRVVGANGTPVTVFQELGSAATDPAAWIGGSADISSFAGQSVRILVEASDAGGGSLVEAGFDNASIVRQ
ncbi:MAG TPA: PQQ-dependent sugar dehydrogenase [Pyrinomonadaceae bacterium]|nr:PQQ-dependent sugar dehydrogenase [Pyrinomonadaceae bacterium]